MALFFLLAGDRESFQGFLQQDMKHPWPVAGNCHWDVFACCAAPRISFRRASSGRQPFTRLDLEDRKFTSAPGDHDLAE